MARQTLLLIHTGGTIGMKPGPDGLEPAAGLVESAVEAALPKDCALRSVVFDPLLDSANVGAAHWNRMIEAILPHDGPVMITHGTDTMSFTGAALSHALAGTGKRVVLCGSMVPLGMGGDAEANLALALSATQEAGEGVELAFAGKRLPAQGLVKQSSHGADAFVSLPQTALTTPRSRLFDPDRRLAILTLSPNFPVAALNAALAELDGAVLRVFGAGTAMDSPALYDCLSGAVTRGVRLRAVSQCQTGGLEPGAYAAGASLWQAGVENGGLDTAESALVTLWLS